MGNDHDATRGDHLRALPLAIKQQRPPRCKPMNKFDNQDLESLIFSALDTAAELDRLRDEIKRRMIEQSGIMIGRVYKVSDDNRHLARRFMLVEGVSVGWRWVVREQKPWCFAWGRMNGKSAAGDGWTIKRQNVDVRRLSLAD